MSLEQRKPRRETSTSTRTRTDQDQDQEKEPTPESSPDLDPAPVAMDTHHEDAILAILFGGLALGFSGIALVLWTVPLAVGIPPSTLSLVTLARVVGAAVALLLGVGFGALAIMGGVVYVFSESPSGS